MSSDTPNTSMNTWSDPGADERLKKKIAAWRRQKLRLDEGSYPFHTTKGDER